MQLEKLRKSSRSVIPVKTGIQFRVEQDLVETTHHGPKPPEDEMQKAYGEERARQILLGLKKKD